MWEWDRETSIKQQFPVTFQLFQQITFQMNKNIIIHSNGKSFQWDFVALYIIYKHKP